MTTTSQPVGRARLRGGAIGILAILAAATVLLPATMPAHAAEEAPAQTTYGTPPEAAEDAPAQGGQQRAAELGLSVEIGFGRGASRDSWTLMEVTAAPPVPLKGRVEARVNGVFGTSTADRDIEVAAGATQVFQFLLPPGEELEVAYLDDGGQRASLVSGWSGVDNSVRVGGLTRAPDLPSPLNTVGTDRPVQPVAVDLAVLALGPRALDSLDGLLVSAGDLAALSADDREAITVAIASGMDLLVTVGAGDGPLPLPWNPIDGAVPTGSGVVLDPSADAWAATATDVGLSGHEPIAASVRAGRGRVIAVAATPGDAGLGASRELWSALVQARTDVGVPLAPVEQGDEIAGRLFGGDVTLPGVVAFAVFVLLFVLLVGPVNGIVLRRFGRRELAWVTVPAITLVFTLVAVTTAAGRTPTQTPVVRAAWWLDGVGQEITAASVQAPRRGVVDVRLPGHRDGIGGQMWYGTASTVERDGDATTVRMQLDTLAQGTVLAWGSPEVPPPLEITAHVEGTTASIDVTNTTDARLDDVQVRLATTTQNAGSLEPGQQETVVLDDLGATLKRAVHRGPDMMAVPVGRGERVGADAAGMLLSWSMLDGSPGTVWVTASSPSDLGLATPDARGSVDDRGAFVAVGATLRRTSTGPLPPHVISRDVLRVDPSLGWRQAPLELDGGGEVVLRFRLPGPAGTADLRSTLDAGGPVVNVGGVDAWNGGCFEVIEIAPDGTESEPEERCGGPEVPCPARGMTDCSGSDTTIQACFEDGSCQIAEFIAPDDVAMPASEGFEIYDHRTAAWVPLADGFPDGTAAEDTRLVSPLGEVLARARNPGLVDLSQRGIAVEGLAR